MLSGQYGVDWDGPFPTSDDENSVVVESPQELLCSVEYEELSSIVQPLAQSYDHGRDFYIATLEYTSSKVST